MCAPSAGEFLSGLPDGFLHGVIRMEIDVAKGRFQGWCGTSLPPARLPFALEGRNEGRVERDSLGMLEFVTVLRDSSDTHSTCKDVGYTWGYLPIFRPFLRRSRPSPSQVFRSIPNTEEIPNPRLWSVHRGDRSGERGNVTHVQKEDKTCRWHVYSCSSRH